jgi:hypothetical protein
LGRRIAGATLIGLPQWPLDWVATRSDGSPSGNWPNGDWLGIAWRFSVNQRLRQARSARFRYPIRPALPKARLAKGPSCQRPVLPKTRFPKDPFSQRPVFPKTRFPKDPFSQRPVFPKARLSGFRNWALMLELIFHTASRQAIIVARGKVKTPHCQAFWGMESRLECCSCS